MVTRLLDCTPNQLLDMNANELLTSIEACEGRVIVSEIIGDSSLYQDISNAELAVAFGADLLLLNLYDVYNPKFANIDTAEDETVIDKINELTGAPVGINLEPVAENIDNKINVPAGRQANRDTAQKALEQGADFLVLTGNPETGVTNQEIIKQIKAISAIAEETIIMAGKMHQVGVQKDDVPPDLVQQMIESGADVILLPIPGTVPGITVDEMNKIIEQVHQAGGLVMNTIGTSQESANQEVIQELALNSKLIGADLHHIGDAGYQGIAIPENIRDYSIAIRGRRHTYKRMSISINK